MNIYEKETSEQEMIERLNEIYGTIKICGMTFDAGYALKKLDPTALRCAIADEPIIYVCGECQAEFEDKGEAEDCCKNKFEGDQQND